MGHATDPGLVGNSLPPACPAGAVWANTGVEEFRGMQKDVEVSGTGQGSGLHREQGYCCCSPCRRTVLLSCYPDG